jgi:hypothetical protein
MVKVIGVLQQTWQAGAAAQRDFALGDVLWAPRLDFRGANPKHDFDWL